MNIRITIAAFIAALLVGGLALAPVNSYAQNSSAYKHRQSTKNTWRNVGIGSAAVGVYGLVTHQNNLALLGAAGAGYSAYRYEHDRKSQRWLKDHSGYYARHRRHSKRRYAYRY
jgi:hypothetical protein